MPLPKGRSPNYFNQPQARAYQPTMRDNAAGLLQNLFGDSYAVNRFSRGLLGSSGLGGGAGPIAGMGLLDMTPLGAAFALEEAGRKIGRGDRAGGVADAALAVVPIPAAARVAKGGAKAVARGVAPKAAKAAPRPGFTAYHGSPHAFDAFDASKIGTGEGNQAFGRGLYLAETEDVARSYRDIAPATIDPGDNARRYAHTYLDIGKGDPRQAADLIRGQIQKTKDAASFLTDGGSKQMAELERALGLIRSGEVSKGNMYQVRVNADPNAFIDYDAPLRSQPQNVRTALGYTGAPKPPADPEIRAIVERALRESGGDPRQVAMIVDNDGTLYKRALAHAERRGVDHEYDAGGYIEQVAEEYLRSLDAGQASGDDLLKLYSGKEAGLAARGVPGVKYNDGLSRGGGAGEGSRNFVVFDPRIIDIMKRYGVAAPVAAAILAGTMQPPKGREPGA